MDAQTNAPANAQAKTIETLAPEALLGDHNGRPPVDIWAAGCVIAEMFLEKQPLFLSHTHLDCLLSVFQLLGTPTKQSAPQLATLKLFTVRSAV